MNTLEIEKELLESSKWIESNKGIKIKSFLENKFDSLLHVFILHHHFGQSEEYFIVMVNGKYVVEMEIADGNILEYDSYKVREYLIENKKMPTHFKRRIEIAKSLSFKNNAIK